MNRRGFLGLLAAAPAAVVLAPDLAEMLAPRRTIFLPPRGGWRVDMSHYLTNNEAWFLKTQPDPATMFWRKPLTEESLEEVLVAMVRKADELGRKITYHPTRLIVHPSWTCEQVEERIRQL